jgi:hypothetical protein
VNFDEAMDVILGQLKSQESQHFGPRWINQHCPLAYHFLINQVKTEIGEVDWDRITLALPGQYQSKWWHLEDTPGRQSQPAPYRNSAEVDLLLAPHRSKLYTFYAIQDKQDYIIRDLIAIRLVRLAQKGNVNAKEYLLSLLPGVIEAWCEKHSLLGRWRFYHDLLEEKIVGCMTRYRYSGSFFRYLRRSLEYGSYRLRVLEAFSLDELMPGTERSLVEYAIQDSETGAVKLFRANGCHSHQGCESS